MISAEDYVEIPCPCEEGAQCPHYGRLLVGHIWRTSRDSSEYGRQYRALWVEQVKAGFPGKMPAAHNRLRVPCRHVGPPTGETAECPTCGGRVRVKVLACDVFGRCTVGRDAGGGVACCLTCERYEAGGEGDGGCVGGCYTGIQEEVEVKRPVKWAYGVTTVPARRRTLLPQTLGSLRLAGFGQPRLFVDGATHAEAGAYEAEFLLPATAHDPRVNVFGNWWLALAELFVRDPLVDRYAIFQDDLVTCRNVRAYLDRCEYKPKTYWNLFTFLENEQLVADKAGWIHSSQRGRGAVALVFDRETVVTLLSARHMVERPLDVHRGWRNVDGGVLTSLQKAGWTELIHAPSLVQHTGSKVSTIGHPYGESAVFPGDVFDALTLLEAAPGGAAPPATMPTADQDEAARVRAALAADEARLAVATDPRDRARLAGHVRRYTALLESMRAG